MRDYSAVLSVEAFYKKYGAQQSEKADMVTESAEPIER